MLLELHRHLLHRSMTIKMMEKLRNVSLVTIHPFFISYSIHTTARPSPRRDLFQALQCLVLPFLGCCSRSYDVTECDEGVLPDIPYIFGWILSLKFCNWWSWLFMVAVFSVSWTTVKELLHNVFRLIEPSETLRSYVLAFQNTWKLCKAIVAHFS